MILLNGKTVVFGQFPNKESYMSTILGGKYEPDGLYVRAYNKIDWRYESEREIVQLAILKDHLDFAGTKSHLKIHYMPHSRMDRRNTSYAFSLLPVVKLIKAMDFDMMVVFEPHSDVTPALLDCDIWNWCAENIINVIGHCESGSVFYPDAGAQKRYNFKYPSAVGMKTRDFETGEIISFDYFGDITESVLMVDDMCSKGGTFLHSAKLLRKNGAKKVFAMVAYCENTVFEGELFDHIDALYISKYNVMSQENEKLILI